MLFIFLDSFFLAQPRLDLFKTATPASILLCFWDCVAKKDKPNDNINREPKKNARKIN